MPLKIRFLRCDFYYFYESKYVIFSLYVYYLAARHNCLLMNVEFGLISPMFAISILMVKSSDITKVTMMCGDNDN